MMMMMKSAEMDGEYGREDMAIISSSRCVCKGRREDKKKKKRLVLVPEYSSRRSKGKIGQASKSFFPPQKVRLVSRAGGIPQAKDALGPINRSPVEALMTATHSAATRGAFRSTFGPGLAKFNGLEVGSNKYWSDHRRGWGWPALNWLGLVAAQLFSIIVT